MGFLAGDFMKKWLILGLLGFMAWPAWSQGYQADQVPSRARRWYQEAQQAMDINPGDTGQVITLLKKALDADPNYLDAVLQLAGIYEKSRAYDKAIAYFARAVQIDSVYALPAYFLYAQAEAGAGHFQQALQRIGRYLSRKDLPEDARARGVAWQAHFAFGLQSQQARIPFQPVNLGDSINTADAEYLPSMPIHGDTLIFTRQQSGKEDFFISRRLDDHWSQARSIGPPVNSSLNEGAQSISQDGRILFYAIGDRPGGLGRFDIYYAVRQADHWSEPRNVGPPVNSPFWDTQPCLSPDNQSLYFVSDRPGGYGGSDIYVSHLQPDGRWGRPVNLGDSVNTPGDESSPFIHADNMTLYFASNGWPGVGNSDLYYTRRALDGHWETPHNLGYPINTIDHEGSLFVAADGKTAYFASNRSDSRGSLDLYSFVLYPEARPRRTLYVEGYVYDRQSGERLAAVVRLNILDAPDRGSQITTHPDGTFLITLPEGYDYAFNVSKPGYLFYSDHFSLRDSTGSGKPFRLRIALEPLQPDARVTLHNIFFDFDRYSLKPESRTELDQVVRLMQDNPRLKIQINGYTDSIGTEAHNLELSQQRAEAVVDYLKSRGIQAERLRAKGYGASHPVAPNLTEEGRAQNRRTEMLVLSNE
jgi:outer membrane protein OmpA-like peptidoglycan-associated protein/tetratricopeptide (TPR) repeat protein